VEGGLTLKERLERLVAAATSRRVPRGVPAAARRGRVPVEELIQGRRVENDRGEYFLVEGDLHLDTFHGDVSLARFRAVGDDSVAILAGEPGLPVFDLRRAVFLDTETTGLAGGAGTAAFLVGLGFVEDDRVQMRQYFMRDYHEEAALLHGLAAELERFEAVVTFNGRAFDLPLLEARYRLNRGRFPLGEAPHLDLLPVARRLWKERLASCRLQHLEASLLGVRRWGDVPGEEIPQIYFDYVRGRDGHAMARVLDHNRVDVLSLMALTAHACRWVEEELAEHPQDVLSLGRVYERAALGERSDRQYRRLLAEEDGGLRREALVRLAERARRRGALETALEHWEEAARAGSWTALRALAIHYEHRLRDHARALALVDDALGGESPAGAVPGPRLESDLLRRRARLRRKLQGLSAAALTRGSRPAPG
jgi:uncharacterized protein YprB with RNaseH-like and TPR domain